MVCSYEIVTMASRATIAMEIGKTWWNAAVPARARTSRISCVAYAVELSASDAKTARPTALPIAWCGASAVGSGRPTSHIRHHWRRGGRGVDGARGERGARGGGGTAAAGSGDVESALIAIA